MKADMSDVKHLENKLREHFGNEIQHLKWQFEDVQGCIDRIEDKLDDAVRAIGKLEDKLGCNQ